MPPENIIMVHILFFANKLLTYYHVPYPILLLTSHYLLINWPSFKNVCKPQSIIRWCTSCGRSTEEYFVVSAIVP